MKKSPTTLASELLEGGLGGLEAFRIHEFADDEAAHDDESVERLYAEFFADFEYVQAELSTVYGEPWRVGMGDDEIVPLNGVLRFAVWDVGDTALFASISHEDRGVPVLLMLGTTGHSVS